MELSAKAADVEAILLWRDMYRLEMPCQIIHDSLHSRKGWTRPYLLSAGGVSVGYGSIAVGGPWKGKPTVFEWYVVPRYRSRIFDLFGELLAASGAIAIVTQSNAPLLTAMLHTFAQNVISESILFHDKLTTTHAPPGAMVRRATPDDAPQLRSHELDSDAPWVVEADCKVAAAGGVLFHYNRPYGDIYMKVAEPCRRRGLGSYLVQELKRICYEHGNVPAARCNTNNIASRRTLQKAGFVPCGHILIGSVTR